MHQSLAEAGALTNYSELKGRPHWWKGVMVEPGLVDFYKHHLEHPRLVSVEDIERFDIVVANPHDMSSKFGVKVLYLQNPALIGYLRVQIDRSKDTWMFEPENIMAFEIGEDVPMSLVRVRTAIGEDLVFSVSSSQTRQFWLSDEQQWASGVLRDRPIRTPVQFGGLDAFLRTPARVTVQYTEESVQDLATQTASNLYQ